MVEPRRLFVGTAAIMAALISTGSVARAECSEGRVDLRGDWGTARFSVEVADSEAERSLGLMHRESIPRSSGMLFVYPNEGPVSFWMKNTLIALDMVFADSTGQVVHVHSNAIPGDLTPIPGGGAVQYVLEINGGLAKAMGIGPGSQIRHPSIDGPAAWPCDE